MGKIRNVFIKQHQRGRLRHLWGRYQGNILKAPFIFFLNYLK